MDIGVLPYPRSVGRRVEAPLTVRHGRGLEGLSALRTDWNAIAAQLPDAGFHHDFAWHLCTLRNLERDPDAVRFISFQREGRPVVIIPLRRALRIVAGIPLRLWELPFAPHIDLCDILVAPGENSAELLCELVRALQGLSELPWDALHFPNLVEGATALHALRAAPLSFVRIVPSGRSMFFPCDNLANALRDAPAQFLRNLRRQRRKLDALGKVEWQIATEPRDLTGALADFLRIETSGWKGCHGTGSAIMLHHEVEAFYRDLTWQFGAAGRCAISLLTLDGKTIAAQYGLIAGRRFNLLKIAYDQTFAAEAPGHRLLHEVLTDCCRSKTVDELSLVTGPAWTEGRWNPQSRTVWTAHVFNTTPRGLAACAMARLKPMVTTARNALARES